MLRLWTDKVANLCRERQRAAPRGRRGAPRPKGGAEQLGAMTHVPIAVSTTPLGRGPHGGCCTNFAGSKLWHRSVDRPPKLQSCWQGWLHLWLCVLLAMHITLRVRTAGSAAALKTTLMSVEPEANLLQVYAAPLVSATDKDLAIQHIVACQTLEALDKAHGIEIDLATLRPLTCSKMAELTTCKYYLILCASKQAPPQPEVADVVVSPAIGRDPEHGHTQPLAPPSWSLLCYAPSGAPSRSRSSPTTACTRRSTTAASSGWHSTSQARSNRWSRCVTHCATSDVLRRCTPSIWTTSARSRSGCPACRWPQRRAKAARAALGARLSRRA